MLQNEKCHLLIEHETQKLKELDEEHSLEMKEWREKLRPRKKVFYPPLLQSLQPSSFLSFVSAAPCRP